MEPIKAFHSHVVPLLADDVDTDQIIPARFLKVTDKQGLGEKLFSDWRYLDDGAPRPEFILNRPSSQGSQVLLAGSNFGSGSSREHAPWALTAWGFRAVIARSFADIFRGNALKNALLPIAVDERTHEALRQAVAADPSVHVHVDLSTQTLTVPGGQKVSFDVDDFSKHCLLHGIDELGYIQSFQAQIDAFEQARGDKVA